MARDDEAARYQQAAQLALDQLEWCIAYLRDIRKMRISKQLAKNHAAINRRLGGTADGTRSRPRP